MTVGTWLGQLLSFLFYRGHVFGVISRLSWSHVSAQTVSPLALCPHPLSRVVARMKSRVVFSSVNWPVTHPIGTRVGSFFYIFPSK